MDCAMPATFKDLCLDAVDDRGLANWWCTAMGYPLKIATTGDDAGQWTGAIEDPAGAGPTRRAASSAYSVPRSNNSGAVTGPARTVST
jgi:hypothetical protein